MEIVEDIEELRKIVKAFLEYMKYGEFELDSSPEPCLCGRSACEAHRALFEAVYGPIYLCGDEFVFPVEWEVISGLPFLQPKMRVMQDYDTGRIEVILDKSPVDNLPFDELHFDDPS